MAKIVAVFFSYFGTSSPAEVEDFGCRQGAFLESGTISRKMKKKILEVLKFGDSENLENIGELFAEQAANVLGKMVEYREYLDRAKEVPNQTDYV